MDAEEIMLLRKKVVEYVHVKEEIKKLMERKKVLEASICSTMSESETDTLELPDGTHLTHQVKESLTLTKERKGKGKKKASKEEDSD